MADECLTDEVANKACMEYSAKLDELEALLNAPQISSALDSMKQVTDEISAVKLSVPEASVGAASPELVEAVARAKAVTDEMGVTSDEAKLAWENVEEIASAGNANAMGGSLSADECLIEAAKEACDALEELNRVLSASKKSM